MTRKRFMKNRVRSLADFQKVLHALCVDLGQAADHYTLFRNLMRAKEGPFTKAVSGSQTFWGLTYGAHLETALFRLCRAYDQDADALTLRTLMETIRLQALRQCRLRRAVSDWVPVRPAFLAGAILVAEAQRRLPDYLR